MIGPITRSVPIARRRPKRLPGYDDPEFRAWIKAWPCYVCLKDHCERHNLDFGEMKKSSEARGYFYRNESLLSCGLTEVAHIGIRGLSQRCRDSESMPLGTKHHDHATAGGAPDSHHTLGAKFWGHHGLDRAEVIAEMQWLYQKETGRSV